MNRRPLVLTCMCLFSITAAVSGCVTMVTPVPRVMAVVVPAAPPPVTILPPAPAYLVAPPLWLEVTGPSNGQPEANTGEPATREKKSRSQSDHIPSRGAGHAAISI